ncbi:hypothetical protein GGR53DRAFT_161822 [Hypoxylon sp. FL1150]|nr:hypothetical protein GGR53DRAFT_161822 [Hypoxylon sp. FL1150]
MCPRDSSALGNLQRPHCSRCSEAGYPCTYSKEKGKPGPRGARPRNRLAPAARLNSASLSSRHQTNQSPHDDSSASESIQSHSPGDSHLLNGGLPMQQFTPEFSDLSLNFEPSPFIMKLVDDHFMYPGYYLTASQERDMSVLTPLFHR